MFSMPEELNADQPHKKNIKNIYVQKINSLIKISRDNLVEDEVEMITNNKIAPKKIKKVYSEIDKTALKLEKNRESARKARQRKNFYIKLLQNQVLQLRKQLAQSETVQLSSSKYLSQIKNSSRLPQVKIEQVSLQDDLDKYISQENLADLDESRNKIKRKAKRLTQVVDEYKQWFIPELFVSISNLKKPQRNDLHQKIFKHAERQSLDLRNTYEDKDALNLRVILPLEEPSSEMKVTNILKTLNNNMQQVKQILNKCSEVNEKLKQIILSQEINDLEVSQIAKARIINLITQMNICKVGDKTDKIIQRSFRWNQFMNANMFITMQKVVQFNTFIECSTNQEVINQIKQQYSQMEDQNKYRKKS